MTPRQMSYFVKKKRKKGNDEMLFFALLVDSEVFASRFFREK